MVRPRSQATGLCELGPRYRAQRALGEGGFGVVYEALDRSTGQKVAIKTLTRAKADALTHFKREFRALADVNHPHLVGLRELYEHEGTWLIVMELIEGTDLLSWVRTPAAANDQGQRFDEARLRKAFGGVVQGLAGLHAHGLLHRDLKPSNVRVRPDGRAVLLDFGLVTLAAPDQQSTQRGAPGTVAYMAPEQAASRKLTAAADFYALGASLYEALTGQLPFSESTPLAMLMRKTQEDPPAAGSLDPKIPHDLDWLCSALLSREAERRPAAHTILQTLLGTEVRAARLPSLPIAVADPTQSSFHGRSFELDTLTQALARTHEGELSLVIIEGESGIGKSALVSHFVRRQCDAAPQTWVLSGRCYEHERVPYKALDGCMDALAKALNRLPIELCTALLPRHAGLVAELFPALRIVKPLVAAPVSNAPAEPAARRQEAFRVLGELLGKLAESRPLILVIDDLQWADLESFRLLRTLLLNHPPPILIACTVRPDHELSNELREALAELGKGAHTQWLRLRGLEAAHTEPLARSLLGSAVAESLIEQITYESRGHPLLLAELARYAQSHGTAGVKLTLDAALGARIEALMPAARNVLEVLAVSVAPRSEVFFAQVCGAAGFGDAVKHLLGERLIRRNSALELTPAHDRIRAAVVARIAGEPLSELHRALAQRLESDPHADASERALHWDQAGEPARACAAYTQAAAAAMSALAFAGASAHYARALELLGDTKPADRLSLSTQRAHAMAALGNSVEAAQLFERAALLADGPERVRLRVLAAQHQIQSAQFEAGLASTRAVLAELDVPLPAGQGGAIARILWERMRIGLRGTEVEPRSDVAPSDRMLLDAITGLVFPLSWADFALGNALNMQHLRRALDLGEPGHAARALAHEATLQAMQGRTQECERLMTRAGALASTSAEPVSRAFVALARGSVALFCGLARVTLDQTSTAEELLVTSCPDETWLLTNVRSVRGAALFFAGEHRELVARSAAWLAEASDRQDLFAMAAQLGVGMGHVPALMRDAPDEALHALRDALAPWSERPFSFAHYGEMLAMGPITGYAGTAAGWTWHRERQKAQDSALFYRAGPPRQILLHSRATAALTAAIAAAETQRSVLQETAAALARRIPDLGLGRLHRKMIEAQLCAARGQRDSALAHARCAEELCAELHQVYFGLNVSYLLGALEGGAEGQARCTKVLDTLRAQGWQDPWRAATLYMPMARLLEGARCPTRARLFLDRYRLPDSAQAFTASPLCDALDSRTGRTVTLHSLVDASPQSQTRFKQEFRALQGVHHANLARLEALFEHDGGLTIVLEQLPKADFLEYVRPSGSLDCERLRTALSGALAGLEALHQAGFIHGDLRPSHVRISEGGRVLLIGSGLVTPLEAEARSSMLLAREDLAYVAPEHIDRQELSSATDVYALGVCLYQALTERLPFEQQTSAELMQAKRLGRPVPPYALGIAVPADFQDLCLAMLERDPRQRPSLREIEHRLGRQTDAAGASREAQARAPSPYSATAFRSAPFTGRRRELERIEQAVANAVDRQSSLVLVSGESGVGKTALVRHATQQLSARHPDAWVLHSRCYANEQLGFQAFDAAADELARALRKLPADQLATLLPTRCFLLTQLFPVLGGVPQIGGAPKKGLPAEPNARRRAALTACLELLTRIAQERLLVFVIDDLQWADAESFALLTALLQERRPRKLLVLATLRPGEARNAAVAAGLEGLSALPHTAPLPLDRLGPDEAHMLARQLLGAEASELRVEAMAREAGGHPLFMHELASFALDAGAASRFDLAHALTLRLQRLAKPARELFELLALAARPCPVHVLERAARLTDFDEHLRELLRGGWVQVRGPAQLACTHDRLRETAGGQVSQARIPGLYARLAAAFNEEPDHDPTQCAALWDAAGDTARAYTAYVQAADAALAALAFASAERLYARATELAKERQGPDYVHLVTQHAHAFVALGRSAEAAALFEEAARHSTGGDAVRLRVWAAQHQIQSAQFDAGMTNARAALRELGVSLPSSTAGALSRILWERARLALRGTEFRAGVSISAHDKLTLDRMATLAFPVTWADFLPGNALNMIHLGRALSLGDPAHVARALAQEAALRVLQGRTDDSVALFARAEALAASAGDPAAQAFVYFAQAGATSFLGEVPTTLAKSFPAEDLLVTQCPGETWLLTNVRTTLGAALFFSGEHRRLARESTQWRLEAEERKDAFANTALFTLGYGYVPSFMRDDTPAVLDMLERALTPWRRRPCGFAHYGELNANFWISCYAGNGDGWAWFVQQRRELERAFFYRSGPSRENMLHMRAVAALVASFRATASERDELLAEAASTSRHTPRTDHGRIVQILTQAQLHAIQGDTEAALAAAQRAHALCVALGHVYYGHNAAYLMGLLEGGQGGNARREAVLAALREQGWQDPLRAATMVVPYARSDGRT